MMRVKTSGNRKPILIGKPPSLFTVIGENHLEYNDIIMDPSRNPKRKKNCAVTVTERVIISSPTKTPTSNPFTLGAFIDYSRRSFVEENILFWLNVRMCKSAIKYGQISNAVEYRAAIDNIVNNFLLDAAQLQINIPKTVLEETMVRIKTAKQFEVLDEGIFDVAAAHVLEIMLSDIYPRFVEYSVIVPTASKEECTGGIHTSKQIISSFAGFESDSSSITADLSLSTSSLSSLSPTSKQNIILAPPTKNKIISRLFTYPHPVNVLELKLLCLLNCIIIAFAIGLDQFYAILGYGEISISK